MGLVPQRANAAPQTAIPPARAAATEGAARQLAVASGERVEVLSSRTEFSQLFAEPTGRFTFESAVVQQRVRRANGSWADIDNTLGAASDGTLRPRVSAADVRFSAGGDGPLVTMVEKGKTFTVSWPLGTLPKPTVSGDSATYPGVLPDVDLVVRATTDGFSHVLKVNTAAAAANPKLSAITFDLGGQARTRRTRDGSLQAVSGNVVVASAPAPTMWDSKTAGTTAPSAGVKALNATAADGMSPDKSSAAGPSDAATVAEVPSTLNAAGDLVLKPDTKLLTSATFPLFIDPVWSKNQNKWAYSTSNNSTNTDTSRARVGKDPSSGVVYRSYFEFPISTIANKYVYEAHVHTELDHSWSCNATSTHLYSTNPISGTPRMAWNSSASWYVKHLASNSSNANEGSGCADSPQPDMTVNFPKDRGADHSVSDALQVVATKAATSFTVALSAGNASGDYETTQDRWKKFYPDKVWLSADVDAIPGKPTDFWVSGAKCGTGTANIGTTSLTFKAKMLDGDSDQDITATWEWQRLNGTTWTTITPAPAPSVIRSNNDAQRSGITGAVDGGTYRFRVVGKDPNPYFQQSPPSEWCTFKVDLKDPDVKADVLVAPAGPGKEGEFRIRSEATDLAKFKYGWTESVVNEVAATGTEVIEGKTYKTARVKLSAPKYGLNSFWAKAIDTTGNVGDGSVSFSVEKAAAAVARWGLEEYPGVTAEAALTDDQAADPAGVGGTLTATGVTWAPTDAKQHLVGGKNLAFNGAGALTTAGQVVDTTKSYGVAAWVRLDTLNGFQSFIAQDGNNTATFQVQLRSDDRNADGVADKSFCFLMANEDKATAPGTVACGVNVATAARWTHVAASFDASEKKMRIWVDGVLMQEVAAPVGLPSTGPLRSGNRKSSTTAFTDKLYGSVADLQVFDRALVQEDLTGDATDPAAAVEGERGMITPIEVARWDFNAAVSCYDPATELTCEAPDGTQFGRRLQLTQGVMIEEGTGGQYGMFDNTHPDDPTLVTREYGQSQRNTSGDPALPQWADGPVLYTNQSFTATVRVKIASVDTTMTAIAPKGTKQSAFYLGTRRSTVNGVTAQRYEIMVPNLDADVGETYAHIIADEALVLDETTSWHELTIVYNAGAKTLELYVNGKRKKTAAQPAAWNAAGPVIVGNSWYTSDNAAGRYVDAWFGGLDDVRIYQGAMNEAQVAQLAAQAGA
ncbi:LamG domain-containing protein [Actinoplanes hulinensis]|uniref:LamG domain-containing protein n=1 Tax=Actinoplanes hulinensis TaxID=1144547 RepID=A0ABS7BGP1_9ACTN|nr:LamG domain-containing protein [Actinoplanes hulinensis]MBW6440030.1 LamG domain-containing protein [Actinoplanes hulinensis]